MRTRDVPIKPCPLRIAYEEMSPVAPAARHCEGCGEVITDLSALDEDEARAHLAKGPSCIRYVHDLAGNVVHHPPADAVILPANALLRRRLLTAATLAVAPLLAACPGIAGGDFPNPSDSSDAGPDRAPSDPDAQWQGYLNAEDFDQSCVVDDDCVLVTEHDVCCSICPNAAIRKSEQARFDALKAELAKSCSSADKNCARFECAHQEAFCYQNVCRVLQCDPATTCQLVRDASTDQ